LAQPAGLGEEVGRCPLCAGPVLAGNKAFACGNFALDSGGCAFHLPRSFRGSDITPDLARDLLSKGRTYKRLEIRAKSGQRLKVFLRLEKGRLESFFKE
jgi:hypothetical protein